MGDMNYNPYENPNNDTSNHNPFPNYNPNGFRPSGRPAIQPGNPMEAIALTLAYGSLIMCSCLYLSIPMGAMAILFALLSRGGRMSLSAKARNALVLGIAGIVITVVITGVSFYIALQEAGSIEQLLREVCEMYGYDFETLFGEYFK